MKAAPIIEDKNKHCLVRLEEEEVRASKVIEGSGG